jgi:hypothetical protein
MSTALVDLGRFFSFSIYTQSVGLLGRGISPSQGRYLCTEQHTHRINAHRQPCLEWDSKPRSQCSSGRRRFMPKTARPLRSVVVLLAGSWINTVLSQYKRYGITTNWEDLQSETTSLVCVWEMFGWNLCRVTTHPDWDFPWFLRVLVSFSNVQERATTFTHPPRKLSQVT